ncbi:MAG: iron ABC transporter ATPase [Idiomarina sp. T82-3]|jgi:iron(III) transport system ATP-binding protein|uniref:ABC transporter ATP-binding protein n=1 Tax=Idiomarina TaxID=135575 RepID=UPI00079BA42A|nr:ABC transporter ATP-binding protein [Idiomarina sp. T82-3]KXS35881.1 MAG: iron ABC transporter ATPase [Idiomarina sp. T82-3]MAF74487.1 iron ABC transporter ATP-binding protein [Idiomarinaceae bacterium]
MKPIVELDSVSIELGKERIVEQLSFSLNEGDIGCLLGPSGCGKTTLLRTIAGFSEVTSGSIRLYGEEVASTKVQMPTEQRQIGMMFQDFALFPHLTVEENIAFGINNWSKVEQKQRVKQLLQRVDLTGYQSRYPHELSGGQQQRIALARALAPKPKLMLLDEPFSSLDAELRELLAQDVRNLLKEEGITALLVTHDQQEAFAMADKAGVMYAGQLLQWNTPYELYHQPEHELVADFIGRGVLLNGQIKSHQLHSALGVIDHEVLCDQDDHDVTFLVRPDDVLIVSTEQPHRLQAKVVGRGFRGSHYLYTLALDNHEHVLAVGPSHQPLQSGQMVGINVDFDHLVVFDSNICQLPD